MSRSLLYKAIFILVVVLGCIYGVIEVPRSKAELLSNLQKRIHLGLDLKGGSHLILQVQVQDAVRATADQVIEQLRTDLNRQNIPYTSIDRNDPQTIEQADSIEIRVRGIPSERSSDFKALIESRINGLGLTEPTIQPYGGPDEYRILVQLPGVDDPARVKEIMQTTALLE